MLLAEYPSCHKIMSKTSNIVEAMNESSASNVNCPSSSPSSSFLSSASCSPPTRSSSPPSPQERQHKRRRRLRIPQILLESNFQIEERAPSCLTSSAYHPPQEQQQQHAQQSQSTTSLDVASANTFTCSEQGATTTAQCPTPSSTEEAATAPYNGRLLPFPYRLHFMLDDVAKRGKQDIVSWTPCGTMFQIHDPSRLVKDVIPTYFNMTQYKSFSRQLLNYGFTRVGKFHFLIGCLFWALGTQQTGCCATDPQARILDTPTHTPANNLLLVRHDLSRYLFPPADALSLCVQKIFAVVPKRQVPCTTIHPFDVTIAMHVVRFCAQVTPIRHPRPSNCAKQILTAAQPITMYVYVIVTKYVLCRILKHDSFNVDPLRLLSHALLVIVSANMFFANSDSLSSFEIFSENSPHLRWCRILLKTHMVY